MFVATYMPAWTHGRDEEIEGERGKPMEHVRWAESSEVVVVGGDFNALIGGGEQRGRTCGSFESRSSNAQGEALKEWCETDELCWVNGFYSERWRGTWRSNFSGFRYELDGFVMKERERHKYVRKVRTVQWDNRSSVITSPRRWF